MKRLIQLILGATLIAGAFFLIFDESQFGSGSGASSSSTSPSNSSPASSSSSSHSDSDRSSDSPVRSSESGHSEESTDRPVGSTQTTTNIPLDLPSGASAHENAAILTGWLQEQGWLGEQDELVELFNSGSVGEVQVERVRQMHQGVPVYGSNLVVLRRGHVLVELDGALAVDIALDVEPTVSLEGAWETASGAVDFNVVAALPEALQVHSRAGSSHLVWVFTGGDMRGRTDVLVDAHSNEVVRLVTKGAQ